MALPFEGKVAVVTGASRGIGKFIALQLTEEGADVVVCARSEASTTEQPGSIGETVGEITAMGRRGLGVRMDVTNDDDIRAVIDRVTNELGGIDILVNNAAALGGGGPFLGGDPALLDHFYRTNVRAPYVLCQLVGAKMAEAGGGTIVNISSGAARNSPPPVDVPAAPFDPRQPRPVGIGPVYGISKAAMDRMSTGIAAELKQKNIAIITINPGFTLTDRTARVLTPEADTSRMELPEVTAKSVTFVCRDPMQHTGRIYQAKALYEENNL